MCVLNCDARPGHHRKAQKASHGLAPLREEPRGAPCATGPGLQREWLIWDVDVGNALSATCQYIRGNAREERARRCEKAGQGADWLQRVWKLEWSWTWIPPRMQPEAKVDCGCDGVDIVDVNVGICSLSLCPLPVNHIQKLLREERTVRRVVSCSDKIPQKKKSALASTLSLQC